MRAHEGTGTVCRGTWVGDTHPGYGLQLGGPKGSFGGTLVGEVWDHLCVGATRIWETDVWGHGETHTLWGNNTLDMGDTLGWR